MPLSTQARSTSGSCSKIAAPDVTLSTKKTRLGSSENRCTKIAFQARPSGLRVPSSDLSGGLVRGLVGSSDYQADHHNDQKCGDHQPLDLGQ